MIQMNPRRLGWPLLVVAALAAVGCGQETPESLTSAAAADMAKQDTASAVVRLKQALALDPSSRAARQMLGQALLRAGDPAGAALELSKSLGQGSPPEVVMPLLATALLQTGQAKKLTALYGGVKLGEKKADADFRTSLAAAWAILGDKVRLNAALDEIQSSSPDHPEALMLRARLAASRNSFAEALSLIDRAMTRGVSLSEAWHLKGEIQTYGLRDDAAAAASYNKALDIDKAFFPARAELTAARIRAGDIKGAKQQLEALLSLAPGRPEAQFLQAQVAYHDKDYDKARELTQRLLQVAPDNVSVLQLMSALEWQRGSMLLAARPLETALQLQPNLMDPRVNLSRIYLRLGQAPRALEVLKPLIESKTAPALGLATAAEAALQLGRLDEAEALYTKAVEAQPDDSRPRTELALIRIARGDAGTGFSQLETLTRASGSLYADYALVASRLRNGDLDAALAAADELVRKAPDNATAQELRGRVLNARNDPAAARQAFEAALKLEPAMHAAIRGLVDLDLRDNRPDLARGRVESLLRAEPRNYAAQLLMADVKSRTGAPAADVQASLSEAIALAPGEIVPRLSLVDFLAGRRQITAARAAAEEAVAAIPNSIPLLSALGQMQMAAGETQRALLSFRSVIGLDPNAVDARVRAAEVHRSRNDLGSAFSEFGRAVEIDPSNKLARLGLVEVMATQKRQKEVLEIAKAIQQRAPRSGGGYLLEGAVYRKLNDHAASISVYRRGVSSAVNQSELALNLYASLLMAGRGSDAQTFAIDWLEKHPGDGAIHFQLGETYVAEKAYEKAERHFSRALTVRPDYPPALNNLAWVLAKQGKPGAVAHARRALQLQPEQPQYLDTLATALAADKQLSEAVQVQQRAVAATPGDLSLRMNLARLALQQGDRALAKTELQYVAAAATRNPYKAEASDLLKGL